MATTIVYAGTADDTAGGGHATYASVVATYVTADGKLWTGQLLDTGTYYIDQAFLAFDTSSIPDSDIVSAVLLELWGNINLSTTDFIVEVAAYDWSTTVTTADFRTAAQLSALTVLATYDTAGFSTGAYKSFTSTGSFAAAINLTGETRLIVFSAENRTASAPPNYEEVVWTSADAGGTTNDPKLTVTHAAAAPTGTGAITGQAPTVSGSGSLTITGTGAIVVPSGAVVGAGTERFTATGAITVPSGAVVGSGSLTITATGAIAVPAPTVVGAGAESITGTGAIAGQAPTVTGSGSAGSTPTGTGSLVGQAPVVVGSGTLTITGTGAITVPSGAVVGSGSERITGTGAVTVPAPAVSGAGSLSIPGTGAIVAQPPALAAVGTLTITGSGAVIVPGPVVVGVGTGGVDGITWGNAVLSDRATASVSLSATLVGRGSVGDSGVGSVTLREDP